MTEALVVIGCGVVALLAAAYGWHEAYRLGVRHGVERSAMAVRHAGEREAEARAAEQLWRDSRKLILTPGAVRWLAWGERGNSSNVIFGHLTGIPMAVGDGMPPFDASDFRRCRMLLDHVPEWRNRLAEMAELGPEWSVLVENWQALCDLMDGEVDVRYPMTSAKMRALFDGCRVRVVP